MATSLTITLSLFFLGVFAFVAHLGGGTATATAVYSPKGLPQGTRNALMTKHHNRGKEKCSKAAIEINQSPMGTLPNGIPAYTVEVANTCVSGCDISNIHLSCGWFSSARLVNPKIFKRLKYNDCLVNGGKTLPSGHIVSFQYANTFPYALSVKSLVCNK